VVCSELNSVSRHRLKIAPWLKVLEDECVERSQNLKDTLNINTIYYSCERNAWKQLQNVLKELAARNQKPININSTDISRP